MMRTYLIFFIVFIFSNSCAAETNSNICPNWIESAIKNVESVSPEKRFIQSLTEISRKCNIFIPENLKQAASKSISQTSKNRSIMLQKSTATYFSTSCMESDATVAAKKLNHICLGDNFTDGALLIYHFKHKCCLLYVW